jgi:hypothetical protein
VNLERLQTFISTSPSAKLLRSPHAAHIVCFLHAQFKASNLIVLPHASLMGKLNEFLEHVHETEPDVLKGGAETYITAWATGDTRWLRRYLDAEHPDPVYELTSHTEDVLTFLTEILERSIRFVGTESRLKRILDTLSNIVVRGSADPERRLAHLRGQREQIEREIRSIESGESVKTYSPTAIRERFADALSDLTSLLGDFRAVEESFKAITRDVQKRQIETDGSRGEILGFALDAEDSLKSEDQGVSFDEFVRLVLSPSQQAELETIVTRLDEIRELAEQVEGMRRIRGMIGSLSDEAEKVLRTMRRLSSTLRRLLDTRTTAVRVRLAAVLREIRAAAARLAEHPPSDSVGMDVLTELELLNVSERTFWAAPARFQPLELTDHEPAEEDAVAAFRRLAEMRRLDWRGMRSNIANMVAEQDRVSLAELLTAYPPESGAIEVLGYVQIAHDDGHQIDPVAVEVVCLPVDDDASTAKSERGDRDAAVVQYVFEVPRITFLNRQLRPVRAGAPSEDVPA